MEGESPHTPGKVSLAGGGALVSTGQVAELPSQLSQSSLQPSGWASVQDRYHRQGGLVGPAPGSLADLGPAALPFCQKKFRLQQAKNNSVTFSANSKVSRSELLFNPALGMATFDPLRP